MDILEIVSGLPLEDRVEVRRALKTLITCGMPELILKQLEGEIIQAAMVLAHNREYEGIERISIRTAGIAELLDGFLTASKEI